MTTTHTSDPQTTPDFTRLLRGVSRLIRTQHLDSLRAHGLDPRSRRRLRHDPEWAASEQGKAQAAAFTQVRDELRATIEEAVSAEELEAASSTLQKIAEALGGLDSLPEKRRFSRGPHRGNGFGHHHPAPGYWHERGFERGYGRGFERGYERGHGHERYGERRQRDCGHDHA